MSVYIVTEGTTDEAILNAVLNNHAEGQEEYRIVSAGGKSSAESYARSLLVTGKGPVALVVDADTMEDWRSAELQQALNRSLAEVATGSRFAVFVIRPEIESLLFLDENLASDLAPGISRDDFIKGQYTPKAVLAKLMNGRGLSLALQQPSVSKRLANLHVKEIDDLRAFVQNTLAA